MEDIHENDILNPPPPNSVTEPSASDLSGEDVILQFGEEGSVTELGGGGFRISFSCMSSITYAVNNFIVNTEIFIHNHKGRLHSF